MLLAAVYQISDSIQVLAVGFCVVIKIRVPFSISPFGLLGAGLAKRLYSGTDRSGLKPMGPAGFWIGFIIGLTSAPL